jgi:prepilin-type N-terminal cleavage/methylation domain-containing protein
MKLPSDKNESESDCTWSRRGFTLVEVIVAASIMIILCVGTVTVYTYVIRVNQGNNLRSQAQSVLQAEAEYYRSLKFVPGSETSGDLVNHRSADLYAGTHNRPNRTSADGQAFTLTVTVTNIAPPSTVEELTRFKEITIVAAPVNARTGWLSNLNTTLTLQRVRAN